MNRRRLRALLLLLFTFSVRDGQGAPIDSKSILVSHTTGNGRGEIIEFTRTGTVLQSFLVQNASGFGFSSDLRDLEMDRYGRLQIFNGTFSPYLTTLTPQLAPGAATFAHHTFAGWSVVANTAYGGIAIDAARNAIYVNDMSTASPGGATGIIRFDSNTFSATRVRSGEYTKVGFGLDGLLYASFPATMPGNNKLDVIDPTDFSLLRTVTLPHDTITYTGFAVDAAGNIYATEGRESPPGITKFTPQGTRIKRLPVPGSWVHDLDLSPDGSLITFSQDGDVIMTNTDLTSYTRFQSALIDSLDTNVAWAVVTIPEPGGLCLLVCGLLAMLQTRRRRAWQRLR